MNIGAIILWGFAATLILTIIMSASKPLGITRMDIPYMLGTMFTGNRNKAPWYGFIIHLMMGWVFAFIYSAGFYYSELNTWWFGLIIGFVHGLFVLTVGLSLISHIHPRMANASDGPTPTKQLQPPGFMAINYGNNTPVATIIAHLLYGGVLGLFL
jgi:uncharacterized membrane protein YagU involved in acid resistance